VRIELVSEPQHESLTDLLCELHAYYNDGVPASREAVREHLVGNLLATGSPVRLAVAISEEGVVIGLAAIMLTYSLVEPMPDKCRQVQLKELYVLPAQRSRGTGKALMSWVARYAADNGCCRIDWPVKASNTRGISFYESLGAKRVIERLSYRLAGPNLDALAHVQR
jgi:ribosomal protein S18 acetylase RimI-like enzyme